MRYFSHPRVIAATAVCVGLATAQQEGPSINSISQALGASSNLTGQSLSLDPFTFQMVANETYAVVTFIVQQPLSKIGWMAFGTGNAMSNADMNIFWPNSDSSWTISHRTAGDGYHVMPVESSQPTSSELMVLTELTSSNDSMTTLSVLRQLSPSYSTAASAGAAFTLERQSMVYSYCSTNPDSSASDAVIVQHEEQGVTNIDLSRSISVPSSESGNDAGSVPTSESPDTGGPWMMSDRLIVAHATFGCLVWLLVSPIAILIAQFGRNTIKWVKPHMILNGIVLPVFAIITFALGTYVNGSPHYDSDHGRVGLTIFILIWIQIALGLFAHYTYNPNRTHRPAKNYVHWLIGATLTALGFSQVFTGADLYYDSFGRTTPTAVTAIEGVLVGLFGVAFLIGLAYQYRLRRKRVQDGNFAEKPEFKQVSSA